MLLVLCLCLCQCLCRLCGALRCIPQFCIFLAGAYVASEHTDSLSLQYELVVLAATQSWHLYSVLSMLKILSFFYFCNVKPKMIPVTIRDYKLILDEGFQFRSAKGEFNETFSFNPSQITR